MTQIPRTALVLVALLAGLCPLVANAFHEDAVGGGSTILAKAAAAQPVAAQVSIVLHVLGFAALIVTLGILAAAVLRRSPALAGVVSVAGATAVAIKFAEAQTGMALRDSADVVDPGTAEVLVAMDDAGFTVYGFLLSLALGAAALGLLQASVVPSWLAWWGVVMGGLGMVTATVGIVAPAYYVPIPFVLLLIWLVALGLTAARRPFRVEDVPQQADLVTQ